ncbi:MAG: ImmA/IrrE family metallo-endopeptidase [Planctomycetales bacterium]|nr:ImmA/IrrE family metallo-endopeptidase [Planctomycetales bacterium]
MTPEITCEELGAALDGVVCELLAEAGVVGPPVDSWVLARSQRLTVAEDARQQGRARYLRPQRLVRRGGVGGVVLMRPEPRLERRHWALAHELGEHNAHRVFRQLGIDPRTAPADAREQVANFLANRLLLPADWFHDAAATCGWDLFDLKQTFVTASHELIARRMLDFGTPLVVTVCDNTEVTFRRGNLGGTAPAMLDVERRCWQLANRRVAPARLSHEGFLVQSWPIHENGWQREIMRLSWSPECWSPEC